MEYVPLSFDYDAAFTRGIQIQRVVAKYLNAVGVPCHVPTKQYDPDNPKPYAAYELDIVLEAIPYDLEIKARTLSFTNDPDSYPFDTVIVDTVKGYEVKDTKPLAYVLYSEPTGCLLAVAPSTRPYWVKEHLYASNVKFIDAFYLCPREHLRPMSSLIERIHELQNAVLCAY